MTNKKLMIVDGNSVAYRSFFAMPLLTNSKGLYTNAIYGFTLAIEKMINLIQPTHILVAFDAGKTTFRHEHYPQYKGGREKTAPELSEQFPLIRKLLTAYNIKYYELNNYEADDIIGTVAKKASEEGFETIIYTGDKDITQLITEQVTVYYMKKGQDDIYTPDFFAQQYGGLQPHQMIDLKALMGDKSDNIPGVPGVGEKTAIKLISQYETAENVLENIANISGKKLVENLTSHYQQVIDNKYLVTINCESPIEISLDELHYQSSQQIEEQKFHIFKELEFNSLLTNMSASKSTTQKLESSYQQLDSKSKIDISHRTAIYVEMTSDNYLTSDILYFVLSDGEQQYVMTPEDFKKNKSIQTWLASDKYKTVYDYKKFYVACTRLDCVVNGIDFDVMLAAYIDNASVTIEDVASVAQYYNIAQLQSDDSIYGRGAKFNIPEQDVLMQHCADKAAAVYKLYDILYDKLTKSNQLSLLEEVELPLSHTLVEMELEGITVNKITLEIMSDDLLLRIEQLEHQINELAGEKFNINSPKQLGVILFEKLGLPIIKKTKTGYSTAVDVLEQIQDKHEIIKYILSYRTLTKLRSTYTQGLQKEIAQDGRIHTRFNQVLAQTGRLSSVEPNLQNIPIRIEEGRRVRQAFVANHPDYVLLSADYSQIELRVLAHICGDERLKEAFINNIDIHTKTASDVFDVPVDEVTADLRRQAKAVNFGIIYGISDYGLSQNLGITRKEAKVFIDNYLETFKGVKNYMETSVQQAKLQGYVETLLNRRRYIPDITSRNYNLRSFAERVAMNTPIQGTAADIIKLAMIQLHQKLKTTKLRATLLLQVHDELILEVHPDDLEACQQLLKSTMENALKLDVPLEVEISYGQTWYDAK